MCGVFGIRGHAEAANLTYLGLHALQHRGQESAGIASSDGEQLRIHRGMGRVVDVFSTGELARLTGSSAIGHVRYSTAGASLLKNAQPIAVEYSRGSLAIAHNGNLVNADTLRTRLEERGSIFQSRSDTEVIVHLTAISTQRHVEDRIADALSQVEGAYSLVCLAGDKLIAARDPRGIRPLCIGIMPGKRDAYVIASEPSSFELIDAEYVRDIEPGEMIVCDGRGLRSKKTLARASRKSCIFEYVYFARPDSTLEHISVYEARKELGRALARESPVKADVVIPVPDSGVSATIGYAEEAGVPFEMGLVRSHYVGRTFIEPQQSIRHFGVRLKLSAISAILKGKRVIVVDDSIVRGTTSRKIVKMLREAGALEVHMRISSPPTRWPCYYGIDTPTRGELIASSHSVDEINQYVTSDTLAYLSLEAMTEAIIETHNQQTRNLQSPEANSLPVMNQESFCHACWSGDYPLAVASPTKRPPRISES